MVGVVSSVAFMGQTAAGHAVSPGLLTAPLTFLSPGPSVAGAPSKGKDMECVETVVAVLRLPNGSRWQVFGKEPEPPGLAPDA